ncbi:MAG TPA: hypothetical protein VN228_08455 [Pyrinomonadaceae bacterium]|nr:hypothetical protein [Pyrinomonadaceae bacterium]
MISEGITNQKARLRKVAAGVRDYSEPCKNCVETAFFLLAIAWAFYVFVYTDRYKPSIEHPQVTPSAQLEIAGRKGQDVAVRAVVKVKNSGKVKSKIVAAFYNAYGHKVARKGEEAGGPPYPAVAQADLENAQKRGWETHTARHYQQTEATTLRSGNFLLNSWLEPGEEYERVFNLYVPEGFDSVRMALNVWVIRDAPFIRRRAAEETIRAAWGVDGQSGRLRPSLSINNCSFCFSDNWEPYAQENESHKEFVEYHGIVQNDANVELSFW